MIKKYAYEEWLKAKGLQPRTIEQYMDYHNKISSEFKSFTQENIDKFISRYKGNVIRSFIKSFQTYLLINPESLGIKDSKKITRIKFINITRKKNGKRKTPEIITEEEMKRIYSALPTQEKRLMLHLSFYCGLRREELMSLRTRMFNFEIWQENPESMGILTIIGKGGKEGKIPVKKEIMREAYDYLPGDNPDDDWLFFKMCSDNWYKSLSKASKQAIKKHVKPHCLRHSIAMHLRGKGFPIDMIKEFLRHEDISTTQIYSRVTPKQLMESFKGL